MLSTTSSSTVIPVSASNAVSASSRTYCCSSGFDHSPDVTLIVIFSGVSSFIKGIHINHPIMVKKILILTSLQLNV